jgi:hypothetical protein
VEVEQNGELGAGKVLAGGLQDGVEQGAADLFVEADQQVEPDGGVGLATAVEFALSAERRERVVEGSGAVFVGE